MWLKAIPWLLLLTICSPTGAWSVEWADCFLVDCGELKEPESLQFGYWEVPEDYRCPEGRTLRLAFVLLKALSASPSPDPVLYLSGGPGVAALRDAGKWEDHPLRRERDIILVDFRGIGYSEPQLCPELNGKMWDLFAEDHSPEGEIRSRKQLFADCFEALREQGRSLDQYNSATIVKDLEILREQLNLESWNLLSISYGTRMAQTYMRDASGHLRSVILDGPFPVGSTLMKHPVRGYADALESFFSEWESIPACRDRFPKLRQDFWDAMEGLRKEPINLTDPDFPGGSFHINFSDAHLMFFQFLKDRTNYAALPYFIEVLGQRQKEVLHNMMSIAKGQNDRVAIAMGILVNKYDNYHPLEKTVAMQEGALSNALNYFDAEYEVIRQMDFMPFDSRETQAVISGVPALILAGEIDPITPPAYGRELHSNLTNGFFYSFPGIGHGAFRQSACARQVIEQFLSHPSIGPAPDCLQEPVKPASPFVPDLFQNTRLGTLLRLTVVERRWSLLTPAIPLVFSFLFSWWPYRAISGRSLDLPRRLQLISRTVTTTGMLILLATIALVFLTGMKNQLLVLMGLVPPAAPIYLLSYGFAGLTVLYLALLLKDHSRIERTGYRVLFTLSMVSCFVFCYFLWRCGLFFCITHW